MRKQPFPFQNLSNNNTSTTQNAHLEKDIDVCTISSTAQEFFWKKKNFIRNQPQLAYPSKRKKEYKDGARFLDVTRKETKKTRTSKSGNGKKSYEKKKKKKQLLAYFEKSYGKHV